MLQIKKVGIADITVEKNLIGLGAGLYGSTFGMLANGYYNKNELHEISIAILAILLSLSSIVSIVGFSLALVWMLDIGGTFLRNACSYVTMALEGALFTTEGSLFFNTL